MARVKNTNIFTLVIQISEMIHFSHYTLNFPKIDLTVFNLYGGQIDP